jgi:hypothetical protein
MMNTELQNDLPAETPNTDETAPAEKSWTLLYDRIRTLALRKSFTMLEEDETQGEEFDRGARALRTLMSAAEVSLRMKREEAKETGRHEQGASRPIVTDERIEAEWRRISGVVERLESADAGHGRRTSQGEGGNPVASASGAGGEVLGDQRP